MKRNPTQQDIARAAGVSRGLVSMALSGAPHVAQETRERILAAAADLGYTRNLGAAALAANRSPIVGMVLPDLRNPFFEGIVAAIQRATEDAGMTVLISTTANDPAREDRVMQRFRELRVAGIVAVSPVGGPAELRVLGALTPLVILGAPPVGGPVDAVHVDEDAAARLVVDHVAGRGWRSIVHVPDAAGAGRVWVDRRRRAIETAARDVGMPMETIDEGDALLAVAQREGARWRGERAAVIAHNDLLAIDAVAAVRSAGLAPGRDVAVVGYDDTYLARRPEFDVTSVRQDPDMFAQWTVEALDSRGGDLELPGREWRLEPTLAVRSSS